MSKIGRPAELIYDAAGEQSAIADGDKISFAQHSRLTLQVVDRGGRNAGRLISEGVGLVNQTFIKSLELIVVAVGARDGLPAVPLCGRVFCRLSPSIEFALVACSFGACGAYREGGWLGVAAPPRKHCFFREA